MRALRSAALKEEREDPCMAQKKTRRARGTEGRKTFEPAELRPVGLIRSTLKKLSDAPKQGSEGAPDAWLEVLAFAVEAIDGIGPGDDILVITWLDQARREVLKVHPRSDPSRRLTGVFATRSPDRPNPLGLHRVTVRKVYKNRLRIGPIEAVDGTPVVDIKPVLSCAPHDER